MDPATTTFGIIERIQSGDTQAFSHLFDRYQSKLAVFIHYRMSPRMKEQIEIEDLLQETYLRAFRDFHQFSYRGPGTFMNWLIRIAEHTIRDTARYQNRDKRRALELLRFRSASNPGGPEPADSLTPSRYLQNSERLQQLLKLLDQLPPEYMQAILLSKIEGLTTAEMAERLGKSKPAVSLLLHRSIRKFREIRERRADQ